MRFSRLFKWLMIILMMLALSACRGSGEGSPGSVEETTQPPVEMEAPEEGEEEGYTVVDDLGTELYFERAPETVVSLQPSNTEILFALGVGERIVGVTDFDNYPEETLSIERVSDSVNINAERIIELNPDVVIAYTIGEKESIQPLLEAGIPVFVIRSATSVEDVYDDIAQIAAVMGIPEKGEALIEKIRVQIDDVVQKVSQVEEPKQVYLEVSPAPDIYTTGTGTFQNELLELAGLVNLFSDQEGWVKISEEEVISRDPDLIISTLPAAPQDPVEEIKGRPGWDVLTAVQHDEVYQLDSELMTRPGPRIGQAVELVAKTAYPELFE